MKDLVFRGLVTTAAIEESSTPVPPDGISLAWSTTSLCIIFWNGSKWKRIESSNYLALTASEAITAGAPVNLWNDAGTTKVQNANANSAKEAHGFVLSTYATNDTAIIFTTGINSVLSGLSIGPVYLGISSGTYTNTPPGAGTIFQRLGFAINSTTIVFIREIPIQQ